VKLRSLIIACLLILLAGGFAVRGGTPPAGFAESVLLDSANVSQPTAAAYEPASGNLWVVEKGPGSAQGQSRVRVRNAQTGGVTTALTLDCLDSQGERGILGIAFSPDYLVGPSERYVYIYYTRRVASTGACSIAGQGSGSRNRVSRFLESGGALSSEEVLYEMPFLTGATNHNGGTIRFAQDETLYVSVGDNDTDTNANPLSRDLSDPRGKILRLNGDGSVPADNPFFGQGGVLPEIWAWGLRNPFRISIDPLMQVPLIADVGELTWEAIYLGVAGADYGYPCFEADRPFRACNPAPPAGSVTDPIFVYGHGSQTPPVSGNSVTGGPVYRDSAFPPAYRDNYYFADYVDQWMRRGRLTAQGELTDIELFIPDAGSVVDIIVSPAGCLTYVVYSGSVREVCFIAGPDDDGDGYSVAAGDCNDADPEVYPGAPEICNGVDDDCDDSVDETCVPPPPTGLTPN
jgi:glucose/arabinose dehydrogenase